MTSPGKSKQYPTTADAADVAASHEWCIDCDPENEYQQYAHAILGLQPEENDL